MDALKFITCGSVDDGKSTLIGRLLLYDALECIDALQAVLFISGPEFKLFVQVLKQTGQLLPVLPPQHKQGNYQKKGSQPVLFHDTIPLEHITQHDVKAGVPILFLESLGKIHGQDEILVHGYLQPGTGTHMPSILIREEIFIPDTGGGCQGT